MDQQKQQIDIGVVINQALGLQADCTTSVRTLTTLLTQAVSELERVTKELEELKAKVNPPVGK